MSLAKRYTNELYKELDYSATWLPSGKLALGDVVTLKGRTCTHVTTLENLGIKFKRRAGSARAVYEFASKNGVTVLQKLAGTAAPDGSTLTEVQAGFHVQFSSADAALFRATGCSSECIDALDDVGSEILARHATREWPDDHVVISELVTATTATILIANGAEAGIDLAATAQLQAGALDIASAEAGLRAVWENHIGVKIVAEGSLTPLFRTSGVVTRFLRSAKFRGSDDPGDRTTRFEDVDYGNFED